MKTTTTKAQSLYDAKQAVFTELKEVVKNHFYDNRRWIFSIHPEADEIEDDYERFTAINELRDKWTLELQVLREFEAKNVLKLLVEDNPDINGLGNKKYGHVSHYRLTDLVRFNPANDQAGRYFHKAVWIVGLDEERYEEYLNPKVINEEPTLTGGPKLINLRSYSPDTGVLYFDGKAIQIVRQDSRRGKPVGETIQGTVMRKLFKSVNTLHNGIQLNSFISVRADNFDQAKRKLAKNHLDEINRKVKEVTNVPKLIIYDHVKCYIDKSYLETV